MKTTKLALILVVLCTAISSHAATATPQKVTIKPNATDGTESDVFLTDHRGKAVKLMTLHDGNTASYSGAEFRNGLLYVIKRLGQPGLPGKEWHDELWQYTRGGQGNQLWRGRGIDFRVRDDGRVIALIVPQDPDSADRELVVIKKNGEIIKRFSTKEIPSADFHSREWNGRYLWVRNQDAVEVQGFVRIDSHSLNIRKFDIKALDLTDTDWDLDTQRLRIAYSDYPPLFDVQSDKDFVKSKQRVHLYVYDMRTRVKRLIATSTTKDFQPTWTKQGLLVFDNPNGKGRIKKAMR